VIENVLFSAMAAILVGSGGSLEAENLFGEFQDLDPKGVGVLRPDDIPIAISTACELLSVRMDAKKSFFMQLIKPPE
jgi:hypothetical protein